MPKLLAVGGTGQHVGAALSRLALLGAIGRDWSVMVVDADTHGDAYSALTSVDGWVSREFGCSHPFGPHFLQTLTPFDQGAHAAGAGGKTTIEKLVLGDHTGAAATSVMQALFPPSELDQKLDDGFYARPMLGASAFAAMNDALIAQIQHSTAAGKVVICGSFIGGTGAGVLPAVVQRCANPARWSGVFLLNWLDVAGTFAEGDPLPLNMAHGLEYFYRHIRDRLQTSALIGAPDLKTGVPSLAPFVPARAGVECRSVFIGVAAARVVESAHNVATDGSGGIDVFQINPHDRRQLLSLRLPTGTSSVLRAIERARAAAQMAQELVSGTLGESWERSTTMLGKVMGERQAIPESLAKATAQVSKASGVPQGELVALCRASLAHRTNAIQQCAARVEETFALFPGVVANAQPGDDIKQQVESAFSRSAAVPIPAATADKNRAPHALADWILGVTGFAVPQAAAMEEAV